MYLLRSMDIHSPSTTPTHPSGHHVCLEPTRIIPEASILPQPFQHLKMSSSRCQRTTLVRGEGTSILFGPLKKWKRSLFHQQNPASPLEREEAVCAIVCTQSEEERPPLNFCWLQSRGSFRWSRQARCSIQLQAPRSPSACFSWFKKTKVFPEGSHLERHRLRVASPFPISSSLQHLHRVCHKRTPKDIYSWLASSSHQGSHHVLIVQENHNVYRIGRILGSWKETWEQSIDMAEFAILSLSSPSLAPCSTCSSLAFWGTGRLLIDIGFTSGKGFAKFWVARRAAAQRFERRMAIIISSIGIDPSFGHLGNQFQKLVNFGFRKKNYPILEL